MATIKITVRKSRIVREDTISMTTFEGEQRDIVDEDSNPETLLIRKVEGLASLLGCTETQAQRLLFERCESF